jgi:cyclophilin family peptidyl-prolyl cis-trans isomerase
MRQIVLLIFACAAFVSQAGTYVQFRTIYGDIDVELYDQDKPITVRNFIRLVTSGAYRDTFFHRCVPNFVVQGGGFFTTNRTDDYWFTNVFVVPNFGPITNEFGVGRRLSNTNGTIAMAKLSGNTNSANSQWFFNTANNTFLDSNDTNNLFVVFGKVLRGTNILNGFNARSYGNGIVNLGGVFSELPVTYAGSDYPYFSDLVYVDISLLNVQVRATTGAREISWNSVSGKTNVVEFTASFPPSWQTLIATNGTGGTLKVLDPNTGVSQRFYRVRVVY